MESKFKKKSSEYRFKGKEMIFIYLIEEKNKSITILLNQYNDFGIDDKERPKFQFFAESQSVEIQNQLKVLKIITLSQMGT